MNDWPKAGTVYHFPNDNINVERIHRQAIDNINSMRVTDLHRQESERTARESQERIIRDVNRQEIDRMAESQRLNERNMLDLNERMRENWDRQRRTNNIFANQGSWRPNQQNNIESSQHQESGSIIDDIGNFLGNLVESIFGKSPISEEKPSEVGSKPELSRTTAPIATPKTLLIALDIEKNLREKHPDYGKQSGFDGYGEGTDKYICTTFVEKVLKEAGYNITPKVKSQIQIAIDWKAMTGKAKPSEREKQELVRRLVRNDDSLIQGVASALEQSNQGSLVDKHHLEAGDLVQYWYRGKGGIVDGHAVQVVSAVEPEKGIYMVHGAHKGQNGIKTIKVNFDNKIRVYCVRPNPK